MEIPWKLPTSLAIVGISLTQSVPALALTDGEWSSLWSGLAILGLLFLIVHFIPTILAFSRGHEYRWIIFVINTFLGWTMIGWVIALIWAIFPAEKSLADPIIGNPTGIGKRNVGDIMGAARYGAERGYEAERVYNSSASGSDRNRNNETPRREDNCGTQRRYEETRETKPVQSGEKLTQGTGAAENQPSKSNDDNADSVADRLGKLAKLRSEGMLTDEEFKALKARIMGSPI